MKSELALLEKRIEDVVEAVKAVRAKVDKALNEQEKPVKRWRGNEGDAYWYVDDVEGVARSYEDSHEADDLRYCTGNYFETEHECEQYLKNLKTKQKLKDLALELNNGKEIDWTNIEQPKFFIGLGYNKELLEQSHTYRICYAGQVHCLNRQFLNEAKKRIGEQELINLIKSGV